MPIAEFQAVGNPVNPLSELCISDQNRELHNLYSEIIKSVEDIKFIFISNRLLAQ
jgi:hypothetical protein